ncbi:hypothetical protein [Amycolatopsis thailandensis]|nr:hypothetical protein [Amycolatopsis thailandensis]
MPVKAASPQGAIKQLPGGPALLAGEVSEKDPSTVRSAKPDPLA